MRIRVTLLALLLAAMAFAGCVGDSGTTDDTTTKGADADPDAGGEETPDTRTETGAITEEEARTYLSQAVDGLAPEDDDRMRLRIAFAESPGAPEALVMDMAVDTSTDSMKFDFTANPDAFPEEARDPQSMMVVDGFFGLYTRGDTTALLVEHNASVFYSEEQATRSAERGNRPFFDLDEMGAALPGGGSPFEMISFIQEEENLTLVGYELLQHNGRDALKMDIRDTSDPNATMEGTLVVYLGDEPFPAYLEGVMRGEADETDLFSNFRHFRGEFFRGDDVEVEIPQKVLRAMALTHETTSSGDTRTFTFRSPANVDVLPADILATVTRTNDWNFGGTWSDGGSDPSEALLRMHLGNGTATAHNLTLTYTDVDANGFVSDGDTLVIENHDENATLFGLSVAFLDETTGLNVTPGPGAPLAALALLGACALLHRRRRA